MKRTDFLLVLLLFAGGKTMAQEEISAVLSLDSCRALAVRNNKELRMAGERLRAATYEHKAARTKYMPRVSATGVYMHTSREISLLSDEQKDAIGNVGTSVSQMVPLPDGAGGALGGLAGTLDGITGALNGLGGGLVDALRTDTRNMVAAAVMLTQPVYMGGRIAAYNSITRDLERIAGHKLELARQEVAVSVDETYWQIVSLLGRKRLAEGYLRLVEKLDGDVQQMIADGVATKADGLSVRVKVNEARVALIQVNNGRARPKGVFCRWWGLPMDTRVMPEDGLCGGGEVVPDGSEVSAGGISGGARLADGFKAEAEALIAACTDGTLPVSDDVRTAFSLRPELGALSLSADIHRNKVRLARAEYLPTVALTGGWIGSNPSVFNSFERNFKGMWSVGVMVNVPIVTFGERVYKVKAAKAETAMARYELEETREKVKLQVSQCRRRLDEAVERLRTAVNSREEADENLRHATLGMREGVIPVSNVLEAQTAWLAAHAESVTAQVDLRLTDVYMRKALGNVYQ